MAANSTPVWWLGWTVDQGVENGTDRNVDPTFLFNFYTQDRHILHHLATYTTQQKTDRGSLCSSIGGPIITTLLTITTYMVY